MYPFNLLYFYIVFFSFVPPLDVQNCLITLTGLSYIFQHTSSQPDAIFILTHARTERFSQSFITWTLVCETYFWLRTLSVSVGNVWAGIALLSPDYLCTVYLPYLCTVCSHAGGYGRDVFYINKIMEKCQARWARESFICKWLMDSESNITNNTCSMICTITISAMFRGSKLLLYSIPLGSSNGTTGMC